MQRHQRLSSHLRHIRQGQGFLRGRLHRESPTFRRRLLKIFLRRSQLHILPAGPAISGSRFGHRISVRRPRSLWRFPRGGAAEMHSDWPALRRLQRLRRRRGWGGMPLWLPFESAGIRKLSHQETSSTFSLQSSNDSTPNLCAKVALIDAWDFYSMFHFILENQVSFWFGKFLILI